MRELIELLKADARRIMEKVSDRQSRQMHAAGLVQIAMNATIKNVLSSGRPALISLVFEGVPCIFNQAPADTIVPSEADQRLGAKPVRVSETN